VLPQFPSIPDLDVIPSLHEVTIAVSGLKNNKASGPDDIPAEVLKNGGHALLHRLHSFITWAWNSCQLPQQWKDANIVIIYKRKGDRTECGNSRGISLLSATGKVLAHVMLTRLLTRVVDIVVPESQCDFRRQRSTIDMIFVARLLQEKCREQYQNLFFAFIDLTKAFDTVNRTLLWGILSKFGCPPQFLAVLREFHDGITAKVVVGGHESDPFTVNVGVKQGCVLAPVIFNLFLVAVRWVGHVIQMQSNRLPRRVLYSELQQRQQTVGGQKKRFSEQLKATLKKCSIPPAQLETLAADREEWREMCDEGLAAFDINYDQEADAGRARRHTVTSVPATGPRCHICGRVCASDFGLRSHLRCHHPSLTS